MNIVYTFDDNFAEITGVSLLSLLENNKNINDLNVFIVDCGLSDDSKEKITNIAKKYNRNIYYFSAVDIYDFIPIKIENFTWSPVCYVRLFFAYIFPNTVERVIHIDCDTIIRGSLLELEDINLKGNYMAGCYDCTPYPKLKSGFLETDEYFSNGILVMDLKKIRDNNITQKFIDYIIDKNGILPHLDQDVINYVLKNKIMVLPAKYNVMPLILMYDFLNCKLFIENKYYDESQLKDAIDNPIMVHFTGYIYTSRPWQQPCLHWYNKEWKKYYFKTDYSYDKKLIKVNLSLKNIAKFLYGSFWLFSCKKFNCIKKIKFNRDNRKYILWKEKL